jgi:hypothetical protein
VSTAEQVDANKQNWDERVASHLIAYRTDEFVADPDAISAVVREDRALMAPHLPSGSPDGLSLAHLQCHIGTDTLSWARLGAHVTGIDFSGEAIASPTRTTTPYWSTRRPSNGRTPCRRSSECS